MTNKRILTIIAIILTSIPSFAQDIEQKLTHAEDTKIKYGEASDNYLDALSDAIQAAFGAKDFETANRERIVHAEIVKKKYGENSLEYAEDLWRLGNVSSYKGENYRFDCYRKAENIYSKNNATDAFPYPLIMWEFYTHYDDLGNYALARKYLQMCINTMEPLMGKSWKNIRFSYLQLAQNYLFLALLEENSFSDFDAAIPSLLKCDEILETHGLADDYEYTSSLYGLLSSGYKILGNKTEEARWQQKKEDFDKRSLHIALMQHLQEADGCIMSQDYKGAASQVSLCHDILNSGESIFSDRTDSLCTTAKIHRMEGDILDAENNPSAESKYKSAIDEYRKAGYREATVYTNLGAFYLNKSRDYNKALECLETAKDILVSNGDDKSLNYLTVINNLGVCYLGLGKHSLAIEYLDYAAICTEETFGKDTPLYADVLQNKSLFYCNITDYKSALNCNEEAKGIIEKIYGKNNEKYALILQNIGLCHTQLKEYDKAEDCLLNAINIIREQSGDNSVSLIYPYGNLLSIYGIVKKFDKLTETDEKLRNILIANHLEESNYAVNYLGTMGYILCVNGRPKAKEYFAEATHLLEKMQRTDTMDYLNTLLYYNLACCLDGIPEEETSEKIIDSYKSQYINNIAFFNKNEREQLIAGPRISMIKSILFSTPKDNPSYTRKLYDFILFNKGLLLGTSISFEKAVYSSGDKDILEKYNMILTVKHNIASGQYSEEDIPEAKWRMSLLERAITSGLQQLSDYISGFDIAYNDVVKQLSSKDVAIEFVLYEDYTDTKKYAALIAKKGWNSPKFIPLAKKADVDKLISGKPSQLYSEGFISSELYDMLWAPLDKYASKGNNVYFSPDGCIYQLAIEQLPDNKGQRLCEKYNMFRRSSTKTLCTKSGKHAYDNAVLYGGLRYDEDENTMISASRSYTVSENNSNGLFYTEDSTLTRKGWQYLPGTLAEVSNISSILKNAHITNVVFSEDKGNEESFKSLSSKDISLLHIATHGFFISESDAQKHNSAALNPLMHNSESSTSMNRAGLLMSGGNMAWLGNAAPDGIEDGILTADEISELDFNSIDLVILSACETGLGEITDDGVLGLQRAFKNAGVNTIVMSLWEVDDHATSIMMEVFYKNLLAGKSKRTSFLTAQNAVKEKFDDPRYWAAFIILD